MARCGKVLASYECDVAVLGLEFSGMAGGSIVLMRDVLFCLRGVGVVSFFCGWGECCAVCFLPLFALPRNMRMRRRSMPL